MVFNATFNNISAISWQRLLEACAANKYIVHDYISNEDMTF
jgi:hypothetical protein